MSILMQIGYYLQWAWYAAKRLLYAFYLIMVFLSKRGAPQFTAFCCYGFVLFTHYLAAGLPEISIGADAAAIAQAIYNYLIYDHAAKGWLIVMDVPLLILGLFCHIPQPFFQMVLAMFGAMQKPLRPLKPLRIPNEKICIERARIVITALPRNRRRGQSKFNPVSELPHAIRRLITTSPPQMNPMTQQEIYA